MFPLLSLFFVLLLAGAGLALATIYLMARALVRPPRMTDGKALWVLKRLTPRDLGLRYETTAFTVRDEQTGASIHLAGWWIPATVGPAGGESDRTVILVHGYADAKVGAIAWAPVWHKLGFNIVAIDLRAHGESGGTVCTGGFAERYDLLQVVHELVAREPAATRTLFLFGASLGATVVAGAAVLLSKAEPTDRPLVHGVVLDSPFADFRSASAAHMERMGLPGGWIRRNALWMAGWIAGADFNAVRPVDLIAQVRQPVLVLAAGNDLYTTPDEQSAIEAAIASRPTDAGPSVYRRFEMVEHLMAVISAPDAYQQTLQAFTDQNSPQTNNK